MAANQVGRQTITFGILPPCEHAHHRGHSRREGAHGGYFHEVLEDDLWPKTAEKLNADLRKRCQ